MHALDPTLHSIFTSQMRVLLIVGVFLIAVTELGHRLGLRQNRSPDVAHAKQMEALQTAVLALMGLLLAFAFSMAVQRYDRRTQMVVDEANAIGTAYLRTSFLPEAARTEAQNLFRKYVAVRIGRTKDALKPGGLAAHEAALAQIQQQLWQGAVAASRAKPDALSASYVIALNSMIDMDATRTAYLRNHVPGAVWMLLLVLSATGCAFTGYCLGATGRRSKLSFAALPLLITVVLTLVADLDQPFYGMVSLNEDCLKDLQHSLEVPPDH